MIEIRHARMHDTSATREAYDRLYAGPGISHRDSFYRWLIGLLNPQPGRRLLDISCGEGRLVALAQQQGLRAYGLDFSEVAVRKGALSSPGSGFIVGDGECMPIPADYFDYVTHIGSLEHYIDPYRGAAEIGRVLRPDGRACILLPNTFGLLSIRYVWKHGEVFDDGQPLQRYATRRTWQNMLEAGGLRVDRVVGYGGVSFPRTLADARWLLARPLKIVRMAVLALAPINLANHFVFICSKHAPRIIGKEDSSA